MNDIRGMASSCLFWILISGVLPGCSDIQTPTIQETLTHPFGTQAPFARGTSKAKVRAAWGNPDRVAPHGVDELGTPKEEWVYTARIPAVPIDYGHVSRTKHLFFEGESLVRWETEEPSGGS